MVSENWSACEIDDVAPKDATPDIPRESAYGGLLGEFRRMDFAEFISLARSIGITRNPDGKRNTQSIYCLYAADYRALEYFHACATISKATVYLPSFCFYTAF